MGVGAKALEAKTMAPKIAAKAYLREAGNLAGVLATDPPAAEIIVASRLYVINGIDTFDFDNKDKICPPIPSTSFRSSWNSKVA